MWTRAEVQAYANEVAAFVEQYVKPTLDFVATNKDALALEKALPRGPQIIEALGGADEAMKFALGYVPYVGAAFAAYETYKTLGGKPADQAFFDRQDAERGSQE